MVLTLMMILLTIMYFLALAHILTNCIKNIYLLSPLSLMQFCWRKRKKMKNIDTYKTHGSCVHCTIICPKKNLCWYNKILFLSLLLSDRLVPPTHSLSDFVNYFAYFTHTHCESDFLEKGTRPGWSRSEWMLCVYGDDDDDEVFKRESFFVVLAFYLCIHP